jgi:hypothetical protein
MALRKFARSAARFVLPTRVFERIQSVRSRNHQLDFLNRLGLLEQVKRHVEANGTTVQTGPFAGMIYPLDSAISRWCLPTLLGTYERELHPLIQAISARTYDWVIDIGSAEGYYAVGLARMLNVPVFAYDPEPRERQYVMQMAELNGVSQLIHLEGLFASSDMEAYANRRALVVCDCEGFEKLLFTPETLVHTTRWDMLIELHGSARQSLPELPWKHVATVLHATEREEAQNEFRTDGNSWLWCDSEKAGCAFNNCFP